MTEEHEHPHEVDGEVSQEEIIFVEKLKTEHQQMKKSNDLFYSVLRRIASMLDGEPEERESVDIGDIYRRIALLTQCGITESFTILSEPQLTGPCVKRQGHVENGDAWHQDQSGCAWRLRSSTTVKSVDGREVTIDD